jgi:2-amino-4-hydroxy-6-hydroxymethyldihydropteridine diphosphokinase
MILVALGANLDHPVHGAPHHTLRAALTMMGVLDIVVERTSRFYRSPAVPPSQQPPFVNAVAAVSTALPARQLLDRLIDIERVFGRARRTRWEARVLDLDLIDYEGQVVSIDALTLPHPRLHERGFVLKPLLDVAPTWSHPTLGRKARELLADCSERDAVVVLAEEA